MKRYPLHRRTKHILAQLSKELGTDVPWAECFAEIAGLDESVRKCFEPAEMDALAILDAPIVVGGNEERPNRWWQFWRRRKRKGAGTKFWALTLNAEDWFEEFCNAFPDSAEMQTAALLYASAHSLDEEALKRERNDKFKLAEIVWKWRCGCGVKRGQVAPLLSLLMPETPWPKGGEAATGDMEREGYAGYGWMVAVLCRMKADPDWWRNRVSFLKAMQNYLDATMYGETDPDVRNARWEQWRTQAQTEEALAIKRLKDAWKARGAPASAGPQEEPPKPAGAQEGASAAKETANAPESPAETAAEEGNEG